MGYFFFHASKLRVILFALCQALVMTCAVTSVSISGLVGASLAPSPGWATVPYGMQFVMVMLSAFMAASAMKRYGRRPVFLVGCLSMVLGGMIGYISLLQSSFFLNVLAHVFIGIALSIGAYYRFAATDSLSAEDVAKAVSYVTLGGVVAAFSGPFLARTTREYADWSTFSLTYMSMVGIALATMLVLLFIPKAPDSVVASKQKIEQPEQNTALISIFDGIKLRLALAVYASGFGYMLMGLLMMQSSLQLHAMGCSYGLISKAISFHVLAMFLPALFMGKIINKTNEETVILFGYVLMFMAISVGIYDQSYQSTTLCLIGIGLGWNCLYVGGSSLVASLPGDKIRLQGVNESAVALLNAVGALSAGFLFTSIGWIQTQWLAMFLLTPGLVLLLLNFFQKKRLKAAHSL